MYEEIDATTIVKPGELACILGISARHIRRLTEDGVLKKTGAGYNLADSVEHFAEYKAATGSMENKDEIKLDQELKEQTLKLKKAKASIAKSEIEELEGKVHREEDIITILSEMVFTMRSSLMALPGRLAMELVNVSPEDAERIIQKEVNIVLKELKNYEYDPEKYAERVRERMKWDAIKDDESNEED